ncbi:MAG: DoxX family membrane protein [Verrucomicrobia bacterium]|nr:DoxX family membrane protein [Verrucomicrobiota bacterium]
MSDSSSSKCCGSLSYDFAHLLLRLWVGLRLFMAGLDKFRWGNGPTVSFGLDNYAKKTGPLAKLMTDNSFMPEWACNAFAATIGYILVPVGIWVAIGIFTEFGLLAAGLVFLALGMGLASLPDDTEVVSNIGLSILIVAAALVTAKAKTFSIDGILARKKA